MHEGNGWQRDPEWDDAFPYYDEPDKAKALGLYWEHYHCTAREYGARFPRNFMLISTAALNERSGRMKILEFIGYDGIARLEGRFHANEIRRRSLGKVLNLLYLRLRRIE